MTSGPAASHRANRSDSPRLASDIPQRGKDGTAVGESRDGGRSTSARPARGDPANRDRTPEEVCQDCPELLTEVRDRLRRLRELEAQVDSLFPTPGSATAPLEPPDGKSPQIPGYDVRRCWVAAGWASSTRRGTCD